MGAMKSALWDSLPDPEKAFQGATYEPKRDYTRLKGQLERVHNFMALGGWWTLKAIATAVGGTETAVSARLRDLRREEYGAFTVEKRHVGNGLWEYRMIRNAN